MAGTEAKAAREIQSLEKPPAQVLIDRVLQGLGRGYFAESRTRIVKVNYNPHQQFAYKEIQIKRRGRLFSRRSFMGATAFFTLFADGSFVREIELDSKRKDVALPQNIEGYTMGEGDPKLQIGRPNKYDIPKKVRQELNEAGAAYFPNAERYLYKNDPAIKSDKKMRPFGNLQ